MTFGRRTGARTSTRMNSHRDDPTMRAARMPISNIITGNICASCNCTSSGKGSVQRAPVAFTLGYGRSRSPLRTRQQCTFAVRQIATARAVEPGNIFARRKAGLLGRADAATGRRGMHSHKRGMHRFGAPATCTLVTRTSAARPPPNLCSSGNLRRLPGELIARCSTTLH